MYSTEKIAILLATYNGEKYISEQIESILKQTKKEWMLYIHDDGSGDQTVTIARAYADHYSDRIVMIEGPSAGGAKNNFFYLMEQVEAPYYMCADQDDVWLPEKVALTWERMNQLEQGAYLEQETHRFSADQELCEQHGENNPSYSSRFGFHSDQDKRCHIPCLVFTELSVADSNLNILATKMSEYQGLDCKKLSFNRGIIQNTVTGCTMMMNRCLRDEMISLTDRTDVLMHDWWAALIALRFGKISFVETPTILYRQHDNNGVGAQNSASFLYNINRMFQGEDIKRSLEDTRRQAGAFCQYVLKRKDTLGKALFGENQESEKSDSAENILPDENEQDKLVREYARLGELGKIKRLQFYRKNNVRKSTWKKNLGLMIWG